MGTELSSVADAVSVRHGCTYAIGCGFDSHSISHPGTRQSAAFSTAIQHAMPSEFDGKWGSILTLFSQISSAYPAMCEIQRETKQT